MKFMLKNPTVEQAVAVHSKAFSLGFKVTGITQENLLKGTQDTLSSWPHLTWEPDRKVIVHWNDSYSKEDKVEVTFEQIMQDRLPVIQRIELGEFTAVVLPDRIKVGCQSVTLKEFDKLVTLVDKVRNS